MRCWQALLSLATSESNKRALGDTGIIPQLTRCLLQRRVEGLGALAGQAEGLSPQPFALRCLLQLAFDEQNRAYLLVRIPRPRQIGQC